MHSLFNSERNLVSVEEVIQGGLQEGSFPGSLIVGGVAFGELIGEVLTSTYKARSSDGGLFEQSFYKLSQ